MRDPLTSLEYLYTLPTYPPVPVLLLVSVQLAWLWEILPYSGYDILLTYLSLTLH